MLPYKYRFLDLYYIVNYIVITSYVFVRSILLTPDCPLVSREKSWVGLTRETEMCLVMLIIQGKKWFKRNSIDSTIQSLILSLKMLTISFVFQMNRSWALGYLILYILMYIFIQPPRYNGPTKVIAYSENIFRSMILGDRTSSKFVVMFDARWASGIEYVRALFAELSLQFTDERTTFIHVDLTRSPTLAKELHINIEGYAGEIPTFIVFQKGKEVARAPFISEKPRMRAFHWTKNMSEAFGLDTATSEKKIK